MTKNEYVFQSVSSTCRTTSPTPSAETRRVLHGDPDATNSQRKASAPKRSITSRGSMMFPRLFDIFRPSLSTMWPRQTTFRYALWPNSNALSAMRV